MSLARNSMSAILVVWGLLWLGGVNPVVTAAPMVLMLAPAVWFYVQSVKRCRRQR